MWATAQQHLHSSAWWLVPIWSQLQGIAGAQSVHLSLSNCLINHKFEGSMNSLVIAANWTKAVPNPWGWELRLSNFLKQIHKVAGVDAYLTSKYLSLVYKGASFLHTLELNCFIIFLIGAKCPWTQATQNKSNCREKPLLIEHNSANW